MSFLAPLFLLGGLAIALPILFHLIRQTTRDRTLFSSLLFLSPTPPRLSRRSRLENILLLILRCSVLVLLAFGFARPLFTKPILMTPSNTGPQRLLVLVDTSASLRRAGLWEQAQSRALSAIRKATPADQVAIYSFDREIRPVLSFDEWSKLPSGQRVAVAEQRIKELSPGWAGGQAGRALLSAAELLEDSARNELGGRKRLLLVSDMQESSRFDLIQGYPWPKGVAMTVEPLKAKRSSNASVQLVTDPAAVDSKTAPPVRVRVSNSPESQREQFKIGWVQSVEGSFVDAPVDLYLPPGQTRTVSISVPNQSASNGPTRLVLKGDEETYDNSVFIFRPEPAKLTLAYLGRDAAEDPKGQYYFLRRAFPDTQRQQTRVLDFSPDKPLTREQLDRAALLVLTYAPTAERIDLLRQSVLAGGTLLVVLSDTNTVPALAAVAGLPTIDVRETRPSNFAMLSEIDFRHPLFAPFADPRFADFSRIRFWRHLSLDPAQLPQARVLARFDGGDPALLELPASQGRILVLTAGWQPGESQLALSTKFVPLLHNLLEQSGAAPPPPLQYLVGEPVPLPSLLEGSPQPGTLLGPNGFRRELNPGQTNLPAGLEPGIYTVASRNRELKFAVNLDPAESRQGVVVAEDLEKLGAPLARVESTLEQQASRQQRLQNAELENRQKLWRWVVLAAVGVLLVETWLSGRTARSIVLHGAKG